MSRASRTKGQRGELEVIEILRAHGWDRAHRNHQSGGQGGGDIARGPEGCHFEIKRQERLNLPAWLRQAHDEAGPHDLPVVVFRQSRGQWWACLEFEELLALLKLREA